MKRRKIPQLLGLILLLALPARAFAQSPSGPNAVLIVCPGLTYPELMNSANADIVKLRNSGAVALLSPGNARKPDPVANLYASLYAGDTANTKNPNRNLLLTVITGARAPGHVTVVPSASLFMAGLEASAAREEGDFVVICGFPPMDPGSREWDCLSAIVVSGPGISGNSLTSDTTQTRGLVALRDVAPTVLAGAGIDVPSSMSGVPMRSIVLPDRNRRLGGMDAVAHLNQKILLATMWAYGLISGGAVLASLWSLSRGIVLWPRLQRYMLRVMMAAPLALMIAAIPDPGNAWFYGLSIAAIGLILGAIPRVEALMTLTAVVIAIDGFMGSPLVARSALSGYWISGIRFYGIGNEYMGILIGSAMVGAYAVAMRWRSAIRGALLSALLAVCLASLLFVLSYPAFGAKAGGAVTAMVAFVPAWFALTKGRRVDDRICVASAIAGFALVFVWAGFATLTGGRTTHIQVAAAHAVHGDAGYIWHMTLRKAKMAVATAIVPGVITTYIGMIPVWFLWQKTSLKNRVREYLATNPVLGAVMRAGIAGSTAALLFNDSGFVAFVFLFGCLSLTLMHEMLGKSLSLEAGSTPAG